MDSFLEKNLGGKYTTKRKLGEGGFGAVYEAEEPKLQRKVAIKTLHPHLTKNPQIVQRFLQEGIAASRLEHPGAVKIYDTGETDDGTLWIAMEFLSGQPLDELLRRKGKLTPEELFEVMGPVCETLAEAHQKGLIHRDLKPQNIMLVSVANKIVPKVLDFGISKLADSEQTQSGAMMGTPQYMPPEQWKGASNATAASDVYALGNMMYLMLSGRFPFDADSPHTWMHSHCLKEPTPLLPLLSSHPRSEALSRVIMKTLEKDPAKRYANAMDLKQALEQALSGGVSAPITMPQQETMAAGPSCPRCEKDHSRGASECPAQRLGRVVAGKYKLIRLMGVGGMGSVYEAQHQTLNKKVALKMLHPRFAKNDEISRRFQEEGKRASLLKHPSVIEIGDLGREQDGSSYIEMELLQGKSLSEALREGPLPVEQAIEISIASLDALSLAHEKGLIHRDLKPENIFLSQIGGQMIPKVLDFGIAKLVDGSAEDLTKTGAIIGTPVYMSFEQASDSKKVDARSDIYSLGATLYEMLTAKTPSEGSTLNELLLRLFEDRIERHPKKARPELPDWLDGVVAKAMAKDPKERYQSAKEMADALRKGRASASTLQGDLLRPNLPGAAGAAQVVPVPRSASSPGGAALPTQELTPAKSRSPGVPILVALVVLAGVVVWLVLPKGESQPTPPTKTPPASQGAKIEAPTTKSEPAPPVSKKPKAPEGMVLIEGGRFTMGSTPEEVSQTFEKCVREIGKELCSEALFAREKPAHEVELSSFFLDQYEVTNAQLVEWLNNKKELSLKKEVVSDGDTWLVSLEGKSGVVFEGGRYQVKAGFEKKPAAYVTWNAARLFCRAQNKRLPTEAEWEFAARGAEGRRFPWGNDAPSDCDAVTFGREKSFFCEAKGDMLSDVGSSLGDKTESGLFDLAGNVAEWVADSFEEGYQCDAPCKNPLIQNKKSLQVFRGGTWRDPAIYLRAAMRSRGDVARIFENVGFRCAKDASEE